MDAAVRQSWPAATVGLFAGLVIVKVERDRTELARLGQARQRSRAEAREKDAREKEKEARDKQEEARAVLGFVQDKILAAARPEGVAGGLGREVTLRKALQAASSQIEPSFRGRPLVEASVRMTMGLSFSYLGDAETAMKQFEIARERYTGRLGPDHPETLKSIHNLAISHDDKGRYADALRLREETLALRKSKLGPNHPDTLLSMANLAETLAALDRGSEAVAVVDDCSRRAAGQVVDPRLVPGLFGLRLRVYVKQKDDSGCRETAEMWEKLGRKDADSLYNAACFRAAAAGLLTAGGQSLDADQAMRWLAKAVVAGYNTPRQLAQIMREHDLDPLRSRADFRRLLAELFDRGFPADPFAK